MLGLPSFHLNSRGFSLPSVAVSLLIGLMSFYAFSALTRTTVTRQEADQRKLMGEAFASELLEAFRSQQGTSLITLFKANPYSFCNPINHLNRSTASIVNADNRVSLPPSTLDGSKGLPANRSYMVQVVDVSVSPPAIKSEYCDKLFSTYVPGNANERILVTVEVTWNRPGKGTNEVQSVHLSTLVPEW